jgi:hypothetical protein
MTEAGSGTGKLVADSAETPDRCPECGTSVRGGYIMMNADSFGRL